LETVIGYNCLFSKCMSYRRHICSVAGIGFFLLTCFAYRSTLAAESKRVLLIYNSIGYAESVARNIRTALEQRSPELLDIYLVPVAAARAADEDVSERYRDYLGALFPDHRLDLAVAVGSPAMNFFREYGRRIFPSTSMLAIVEERRAPSSLETNETVVTSSLDLVGAVENMLQLLPRTRNISVVIGSSPLEQYWVESERIAFRPFASRVSFRWLNDLSFDDILKHAATLPPGSAMLFNSLFRDASGAAHEDDEVVSKLHAVAKGPIFTFDVSDFGQGIVGGPWPTIEDISRGYATVALRLLGGEALGGLKMSGIARGAPIFDWREMQRWGISEGSLPPGSTIYFRDPTAWERYRGQILGIGAAIVIQAALIGWLLHERQYRHRAERKARETMSELTHMNRLATAGELSASIAHEVSQPLTGMVLNANAALRWLSSESPNVGKARDSLSQIVTTGHYASGVVTSVRAMFKKEFNDRSPVDINNVILTVLSIVRTDLQKHDVDLETRLADQLPKVEGDKVQLQQVVLNLIMNAIESMNSVQGRALKVHSEQSKPGTVRVSVEDTGTGVDESKLDQIFKPLFTTKTHGVGMGLSICRSIIESHGGRIWVSRRPAGGSIFQFELPTRMGQSQEGDDQLQIGT
jgi:signal transduction histidine kinase